jgi:hypothetical protein
MHTRVTCTGIPKPANAYKCHQHNCIKTKKHILVSKNPVSNKTHSAPRRRFFYKSFFADEKLHRKTHIQCYRRFYIRNQKHTLRPAGTVSQSIPVLILRPAGDFFTSLFLLMKSYTEKHTQASLVKLYEKQKNIICAPQVTRPADSRAHTNSKGSSLPCRVSSFVVIFCTFCKKYRLHQHHGFAIQLRPRYSNVSVEYHQ